MCSSRAAHRFFYLVLRFCCVFAVFVWCVLRCCCFCVLCGVFVLRVVCVFSLSYCFFGGVCGVCGLCGFCGCCVFCFGWIAVLVSLPQDPLPDFLERESRERVRGRETNRACPTFTLDQPLFSKFLGTERVTRKAREGWRKRERKCFVEVGFMVTPSQPSSLHWFCGVYVFGGIETFVSLRQTPSP